MDQAWRLWVDWVHMHGRVDQLLPLLERCLTRAEVGFMHPILRLCFILGLVHLCFHAHVQKLGDLLSRQHRQTAKPLTRRDHLCRRLELANGDLGLCLLLRLIFGALLVLCEIKE